jgi:pseudouridine kinase
VLSPFTIACIGAAHLDRRGATDAPVVLATSNPGSVVTDLGGVARNVAENLHRIDCRVLLCLRVGDDEAGRRVLAQPFDTSWISVSPSRSTASYTAILDHTGELVVGLADMEIYEEMTPEVLSQAIPSLRTASMWFVDANLTGQTLDWLLGQSGAIPVAVDAISVAKSRRLIPLLHRIPYLFCNLAQAGSLCGDAFQDPVAAARALLERGARCGVVTGGAKGIAVYEAGRVTALAAFAADPVRDVTGAGDALVAGTLYGLLRQGSSLRAAARLGLAAAAITVESSHSVAPHLTSEVLHARC